MKQLKLQKLKKELVLAVLIATLAVSAFALAEEAPTRMAQVPMEQLLEQAVTVTSHANLVSQINAVPTNGQAVFALPAGGITGGNAITINGGRHSTIISADPDNRATYTQTTPNQRHFVVRGANANGVSGGIQLHDRNSKLTMYDGRIENNSAHAIMSGTGVFNAGGGGVFMHRESIFHMYGGTIQGNTLTGSRTNGTLHLLGSGVTLLEEAQFYMRGGTIRENQVIGAPGANAAGTATGGMGSTVALNGAGVFVRDAGSRFVMQDGIIEGNRAAIDGGAIHTERHQYGSRVLTNATAYNNLTIGADVVFEENSAEFRFEPPLNAEAWLPNIRSRSASVHDHPLNNYDINFRGILFTVTFHPYGEDRATIVVPIGYRQAPEAPNIGIADFGRLQRYLAEVSGSVLGTR